MKMKIKGRYSEDNMNAEQGEWTVNEIQEFIQNNHHAMLHLSGYHLDTEEFYAHANALTLFENETEIFEENGKIVIPTYFREYKLPTKYRTGDDDRLVKVNCLINPEDEMLYITIVKNDEKSA